MKHVIPEQQRIFCDMCGLEIDHTSRRRQGSLRLRADALDFQGAPVADASTVLEDLCDDCLEAVEATIRRLCVERRREREEDDA